VLVAVALCAAASAAAAPATVSPSTAIADAIVRRLGAGAAVSVINVETTVKDEAGLTAEPEATARFAKPSRFVLSAHGARRGLAVAIVMARAPVPRAARAIARDEAIGLDAVRFTVGELPAIPIRPLLAEQDLVGTAARRNIVAGEPLTAALVRLAPLVRSGDEIDVTVRIGGVKVTGTGRASGSGRVGDLIRVMQPNTKQTLTGRITGPGAVEVVE
jgi:flagella basal body P-ring formation protein FlgA